MVSQSLIAYQKIKEMIFHMEFTAGTRIPESIFSSKLNISRTPIRDALRRLEAEGLVVIELNRGATVREFSDHEVREIGEVRMMQDILSAQLASYYGSATEFNHLYTLADICEEAAAKGDIYMRIQADTDFHIAISKISKNARLVEQQQQIYQFSHLIHISKYTDVESSLTQIAHHRPIIQAIRSGDMQRVYALIGEHLRDFYSLDPYLIDCYKLEPTVPQLMQ